MAELGICIAEKLIEVIGSAVMKEICGIWGYESQLESLKETVSTIQRVLLDAEAKRELSKEEQAYVKKLKDAVYDADDLFDEFLTLAELKQLQPMNKRGKFFGKVRCFFSSNNQVGVAYKMSRQVKDIRKKLDAIADDHRKFGLSVDYKPIVRRREETCSYVDVKEIIGRENEKKVIVDMLLDPNVNDVMFSTIVGVGGLGKTALAQLVYHDEKIKSEFPSRFWVCVADQDGEEFDVKSIVRHILENATGKKYRDATFEVMQMQLGKKLSGEKYLLVLDDVWNENLDKWLDLRKFLTLGQGSRIVVTTRSLRTASIVSNEHIFHLGGLDPESSWRLFELTAISKGCEVVDYDEIVEIGRRIVKKCYSVPLALKVVGSLLFGQDICKWR